MDIPSSDSPGVSGGRPRAADRKRPARSAGDRSQGAARAPRPDRDAGRGRGAVPGRAGAGSSDSRRAPDRAEPRIRKVEPALPDDVTGRELDRSVRAELSSLAKLNAETVSRHLVMAGRLLDDDPETAYLHAMAAQGRAARIGVVREAAGLAAYATGRFAEALAELRAARRITGDHSVLPVLADCERGLGRPERALALAGDPAVASLDVASRIEMRIVASGARRDLGQPDAALQVLAGPELRPSMVRPWSSRLFYAYAEALLEVGRRSEAVTWFGHASAADTEGRTDADTRLAELSGVTFLDEESDVDDPEPGA